MASASRKSFLSLSQRQAVVAALGGAKEHHTAHVKMKPIQKIYTKSSNIQNTNTEQEGAKAEKQNQTKHVVRQLGLTNKEKRTKFFAFIAQVDTYPHTFLLQ